MTSAAHPQANGQVKRANGIILQGIKIRVRDNLEAKCRNWIREVPIVLWAACTNTSRATRETPFFLVYDTEAVLPLEVELGAQ